jgi:hypothetical protein
MIIIDDEGIDLKSIDDIDKNIIYNSNFPLYVQSATSPKFKFLSHVMLHRQTLQQSSPIFPFFKEILEKFCEKHKIDLNKITRACINVTYETSLFEFGEPHIDNSDEHKVAIFYLNDVDCDSNHNNTIIFENQYDGTQPSTILIDGPDSYAEIKNKFKIKQEVKSKVGRVLCFDGKYYHTIRFPKSNQLRYVAVFNFI